MPDLSFPLGQGGPEVPVLIGLDHKASAALVAAGQPLPVPVWARGLLDTGSTVSAVAPSVLQQLQLAPATTASTHTAAGPVAVRLFEVSLSIPGLPPTAQPILTCPDLRVSELTIALPDVDVLIGMDVLLQCVLVLDGPGRLFTLRF